MLKRLKAVIQQQRLQFAKRSLESKLREVVDLMEGHKALSIPTGDFAYKTLYDRAKKAIEAYQKSHVDLCGSTITFNEVEIGAPQIKELEMLSLGRSFKKHLSDREKLIGVLAFGPMLTLYIAECHNLYVWLTHWHWLAQ